MLQCFFPEICIGIKDYKASCLVTVTTATCRYIAHKNANHVKFYFKKNLYCFPWKIYRKDVNGSESRTLSKGWTSRFFLSMIWCSTAIFYHKRKTNKLSSTVLEPKATSWPTEKSVNYVQSSVTGAVSLRMRV